ncbi:TetR family transcriptional regulator [Pyxidicoccus caerfyrddinensis]|uniref:TetR/AcrR family transcriptional regulator n=1 Tax=Pyxidicoccus caerfyrddinensis TaxID=2709663 RepID=UPI003B82D69F
MQSSAEVLGRHGYEHVKAEDLARSVGMSVGSLYRRYGSKQHFARTVRTFHEDTFCREVDWAFFCKHGADGVTFREAFFTFWDALTNWALGLPGPFAFAFLHRHPDVEGQPAPGSAARALVREVLLKGEQDGALMPGCARVGEALVWGTLAEWVRVLTERNEEVYRKDLLASAEALWRALAKSQDSGGSRGSSTPPGAAPPESPMKEDESDAPRNGGIPPGAEPQEQQVPLADSNGHRGSGPSRGVAWPEPRTSAECTAVSLAGRAPLPGAPGPNPRCRQRARQPRLRAMGRASNRPARHSSPRSPEQSAQPGWSLADRDESFLRPWRGHGRRLACVGVDGRVPFLSAPCISRTSGPRAARRRGRARRGMRGGEHGWWPGPPPGCGPG